MNTMKVIKNGVEEERIIDSIQYEQSSIGMRPRSLPIQYPQLAPNETCYHTIDGKCTIIEHPKDYT